MLAVFYPALTELASACAKGLAAWSVMFEAGRRARAVD